MTIFDERVSADGTIFILEIVAAADFALGEKFAVLTLRATIMRRQRINFSDSNQRGDE